jgi:hypothetical protein
VSERHSIRLESHFRQDPHKSPPREDHTIENYQWLLSAHQLFMFRVDFCADFNLRQGINGKNHRQTAEPPLTKADESQSISRQFSLTEGIQFRNRVSHLIEISLKVTFCIIVTTQAQLTLNQ